MAERSLPIVRTQGRRSGVDLLRPSTILAAMIQSLYLGRVAYSEGLRLQEEMVALRQAGRIHNLLLLLEHPPVLTLGRNANRANILASDEVLANRGVTIHEINRGGDVTYHGPGQLVGYPIFDLHSLRNESGGRVGPVDFVRKIEEALIRLSAEYGVRAGRIVGLTGVWCGSAANKDHGTGISSSGKATAREQIGSARPERKIGAIGIHVSRGITSHGFAFNVTTDLRDFQLINPCGFTDRRVTSLECEVADPSTLPNLEAIAHQAARQFGHIFGEQVLGVESLAALRFQSSNAPAPKAQSPAPEVPQLTAAQVLGEDTPVQVPREVERLRGIVERPVRA
jgi:lipoyl(octanoyl) transferase